MHQHFGEKKNEDDRSTLAKSRWTRRNFLCGSAGLGLVAIAALFGESELRRNHTDASQAKAAPPSARAAVPPRVTTPPPARNAAVANVPMTAPISGSTSGQLNVLLITIDTLRADRIGPYGFAEAHTPVLDQFAREGVRFDHAICQLPQTNPSHAALMTGQYASTNGVKVHMVDKVRPDAQTIASIFQAAGYQTAAFYSWVSLDPQFSGLDRGFQTYKGFVINRGLLFSNPTLEGLAATYRQLKSQVPIISTADAALGASGDYEQSLDGRADVTNQAVFSWLDAHANSGPFFMWVHYFDPHYPYAPPTGYDHILGLDYHGSIDGSVDTIHKLQHGQLNPNPDDRARLEELYQGEIGFTDAQFGKLMDRLTTLGIKDNTVIVVTGDHGESFGEHGDWTHGLKVFESEIRVPLIMRYPPRLPAGVNVTAPAQLIDILPTFLDLAGLSAKQVVQGTSLLPVIANSTSGTPRVAFTELADESFVSVLTWGDWKMIRNDANGQLQLYNLNQDEDEQQNLVSANPAVAAEMGSRLQDLMKISGVSK